MFSPVDDSLIVSFDNYLTESGNGPDTKEPTTESTKRAGQPLYLEINSTPTVPGSDSAACALSETPQSNNTCLPSPCDQYESCLYQLSKLHLELYRLLIPSPQKSSQHHHSDHSFTAGIDETFAATDTLIEILQHLYHGVLPEQPQNFHSRSFHSQSPQRELPVNLIDNHNDETPSLPASSESSTTLSNHQPDTATVLLILTCYLRLLHIYEPLVTSLYQRLQQSTNQSTQSLSGSTLNTSQTLHPYLPGFNLGCFSLAASSDLNIRLLLHLISQMLERTHKAVQVCIPAESNSRSFCASGLGKDTSRYWEARFGAGNGGEFRGLHSSPITLVAEVALSEVSEKEKSLMGMLYAVRDTLWI